MVERAFQNKAGFRCPIRRLFSPSLAGAVLLGLSACHVDARQPGQADAEETDPYALVDPFIGTGGHGHTHPAATLPFGMIQAGPDTRLEGWDGCSGYHYDDDTIYGFSQTHLSGTGVSDYGDILLMPFNATADIPTTAAYPFRQGFAHADESAAPGHYAVRLANGMEVDIAAGLRSASYRIVFPAGVQPALWVDLAHRDKVVGYGLELHGDSVLSGFRISDAWAEGQHCHFWLQTDRSVQNVQEQGGTERRPIAATITFSGQRLGLRFARSAGNDQADTLHFRIAISAVDGKGAQQNLQAEALGSHTAYRAAAEAEWREALEKVQVYGGTEAQRRAFYTAHYHALLAPNRFDDADGRYRGMDHGIYDARRADGPGEVYTVFSLWDTYRAAHPWYSLVHPKRNAAFVQSLLDDYKTGGVLPIWKLSDHYTGCMIGYHAVPVIVDAWAKGQLPSAEDQDLALEAMVHSAELPRLGLPAYMEHGYIPADREAESVSKTLEYAYDDACIAYMARSLAVPQREETPDPAQWPDILPDGRNLNDIDEQFTRRSGAYHHLFDPESGFFRARRNGGFIDPFDPAEVNLHYTEANAWHYAFAAVQDLRAFSNLSGGKKALIKQLDACFKAASQTSGREQADITGLIGQYAHGNEPSHHVAYLYALLGQPWKTQERVRQICSDLYSDKPDGYCGNEDCGQMSAWYLFSAAGFYPVQPGMPTYTLGSPLFDSVVFRLEGENTRDNRNLVVVAHDNALDHPYIQSATFNGKAHETSLLGYHELTGGGRVVFQMGSKPNREWASESRGRGGLRYFLANTINTVPAPFADPAPRSFSKPLDVQLRCAISDLRIEWQQVSEHGQPNPDAWKRYGGKPLRIEETQRIAFRASAPNGKSVVDAQGNDTGETEYGGSPRHTSPIVYAHFKKRDEAFQLDLTSTFAPQYAAGGNDALIDGIPGGADWRTGDWQGYEGQHLTATLDLGGAWSLDSVGLDFLQDENAWIFYPESVAFEVSPDGENWTQLGMARAPVDWKAEGVRRHRFAAAEVHDFAPPIRYIRISAQSLEQCPAGHKGAGNPCWIFADEIRVFGGPVSPSDP